MSITYLRFIVRFMKALTIEFARRRSYIRHRDNLIKSSSAQVLPMQKALIQMNLQLHKVKALNGDYRDRHIYSDPK